MNLDIEIFYWLNSLVGWRDWSDALIIFLAEWLGWLVIAGLLLFIILPRKEGSLIRANSRIGLEAFVSGILARFIFTGIIRYFYDRARPFEILKDVNQVVLHSAGGSFPSGHAAFFFALATSVFLYHRGWGILLFVAALSISLGRVAAGIHFPSDIFGGAILGILVSILVNLLSKKFKQE